MGKKKKKKNCRIEYEDKEERKKGKKGCLCILKVNHTLDFKSKCLGNLKVNGKEEEEENRNDNKGKEERKGMKGFRYSKRISHFGFNYSKCESGRREYE